MNLTINYKLDNADFAHAAEAIAFNGVDALTRVRRARAWGYLVAIVLVLMTFLLIVYYGRRAANFINSVYWIAVLLIVTVCFLFFIHRRNRIRRIFQSLTHRADLRPARTLSITQDALALRHSSAETAVPWSAFTRFIDGLGVLVILREDGETMEIIPKQAFESPADLDALQDLLLRHRAPRTPAFPVLPPSSDRTR
jgi:hypothetical protein